MNNIIKVCRVVVLSAIFFLTGCEGYQSGSLMNPNYKTIAIAPVKNNTMEPLASTYLRKKVAEQFFVDGSLKVVSPQEADCIVYITIDEVETTGEGYDTTDKYDNYRPGEWSMRMKARFTVMVPGHARPLIPSRTLTSTSRYSVNVDQQTARRSGLELLCYYMGRKVVEYTTEAW